MAGAGAASGAGSAGRGALEIIDDDLIFFDAGVRGPECGLGCSADLSEVQDCQASTVQTCADGWACQEGACVEDACGAAEASKNSIGCDYWALETDQIVGGREGCFVVFVANTWSVPVFLEVSRAGQTLGDGGFIRLPRGQGMDLEYATYDVNVGLAPDDVAILFLSHDSTSTIAPCPVTPALSEASSTLGTGRGQAFNVRATGPVSMFSMISYGGAASATTSASLLLPTSSWGTEHVAVNPYAASEIVNRGIPSLALLAREDDTAVTILPKVAIVPGTDVAGTAADTAMTYFLDAGEYVQISQPEELTGSQIASDKPIGVWGAHTALNIPVDTPTADSAHQQVPPVSSMGSEYIGVRHLDRAEANGVPEEPPWRLVGATDGTALVWEPAAPPGAPTTLDAGQLVQFDHAGPFVVKSQDAEHPFYLGQYMTSAQHVSSANFDGDPEWINVLPRAQYLSRYVFFTDPTLPETSLVVVRTPDRDGAFADVVLDCRGVLEDWESVGDVQFSHVTMVSGAFEEVGDCANGRHEITSELPFGATVWGWGTRNTEPRSSLVSYAYPAGAGLRTINQVDLPVVVIR
jgi:hypothetical protein